MKLVIIRHADPDYTIDSLTPIGWEEAKLLAPRISKLDVKEFYLSPLGRAQDTARVTLELMGRTGKTLSWLQEFPVKVIKTGESAPNILWDWLPEHWTSIPEFYDREKWMHVPLFEQAGVPEKVKEVTDGLDAMLAEHGYVREGNCYRVVRANEDTLVFFCHFGLECVLLGHLLGVSPMVLWHGFCAAPTSVTTVVTEERQQGIASFRTGMFGDISHLYAAGREPSFSARFCETFANTEQRH